MLATEGEKALRQISSSQCSLFGCGDGSRHFRSLIDPALCQIEISYHNCEHVVEIMGDAARQLTNRFNLLHLTHLRLRFFSGVRCRGQRLVCKAQFSGRTFHFTRGLLHRTRLLPGQRG